MQGQELDRIEVELRSFVENIEDTLAQTGAMRDNLMLVVPAELRMAALLEHQIILGELQQAREHVVTTLSSVSTIRHAIAQERATKEYETARKSSEALARSNTALQKALDRARDTMEQGATLKPIAELVNRIIEAINEQGALTILLARTSQDEVIKRQAVKLEDGIRQIEKEGKQQQLKTLYGNRAKLEEQAAQFGARINAPLNIQNELENIEQEIANLKEELDQLTPAGKARR